ncbi:PmoA family protein, partial [Opitutaceae bacterium]|nr:PmoA family protein [Opitutaceae bacterium]
MNTSLGLDESIAGTLTIGLGEGCRLWSYCFEPETPAKESTRPFIHPLCSIDGDVLTNLRPNDHPWHHGISFTLTSVNGVNFWGGPSHRVEDSYQWRSDQGSQRHLEWLEKTPERLVQRLAWIDPQQNDRVLIEEERTLQTSLIDDGWTLRWTSQVSNPGAEDLVCENYHSLGGLEGSHYSGLQVRGVREFLHQHGDDTIKMVGESGSSELDELHGESANWIEWHGQTDTSLRRTRIRFESLSGPIPWFVRPNDPMVAFAPHRE